MHSLMYSFLYLHVFPSACLSVAAGVRDRYFSFSVPISVFSVAINFNVQEFLAGFRHFILLVLFISLCINLRIPVNVCLLILFISFCSNLRILIIVCLIIDLFIYLFIHLIISTLFSLPVLSVGSAEGNDILLFLSLPRYQFQYRTRVSGRLSSFYINCSVCISFYILRSLFLYLFILLFIFHFHFYPFI